MRDHHLVRKCLAAVFVAVLGVFGAAATQAQDKMDDDGPLGKVHTAEGVKCVKCHGTAKKSVPVAQEKCLACHGKDDGKALAAKTAKVLPVNPHDNRHYGTEADCALCHRQHEPSVNFCLDCHPRFNFKTK